MHHEFVTPPYGIYHLSFIQIQFSMGPNDHEIAIDTRNVRHDNIPVGPVDELRARDHRIFLVEIAAVGNFERIAI